jgi:hypothetical protein
MKHLLFTMSIIGIFSCHTGQWNLNKTIGFRSNQDFTIVFARLNEKNAYDSIQKRWLDTALLNTLREKKLGELAENDGEQERDMHFVVKKDYKNALRNITAVIQQRGWERKVQVIERIYRSDTLWSDKIIYPAL